MSEWRENNNGNHVYVLDSGEVMTVYLRDGLWFGVYDECFTDEGVTNPERAMALMERAVLEGERHLLVRRRPRPTGWSATKAGGYHCIRGRCTLTVKQAKSGKWYLLIDQTLLKDRWFDSAEEAKRQGDLL
ncbi:MAG: hypothetical protein ACKO0Z_02755 [Betaproteobacteria bacterium]